MERADYTSHCWCNKADRVRPRSCVHGHCIYIAGCQCCRGGVYTHTWPMLSSCGSVHMPFMLAVVLFWLEGRPLYICGRSRSASIMHFFRLIFLLAFFFFVRCDRTKLWRSSPMRPRALFMNTLRPFSLFLKFSLSSSRSVGSFENIRCSAECALLHGLHRTERMLSLPQCFHLRDMVHGGVTNRLAVVT